MTEYPTRPNGATRRKRHLALTLGRVLGQSLDHALAEFQGNPVAEHRESAARDGLKVLELLIQHAAPILAHHRAALAAEACDGGADIDTWTGRDLENDPEMMRAARIVTAQMLDLLPGLVPPVASEVLPSNLLTLNEGDVRPFLTPAQRGKGGASQKDRYRKELLGTLFWMRLGFEGGTKAAMVTKFTRLTGYSEDRAIKRIVAAVPAEKRDLMLSIGRSRAARKPDPVYCPLPNPTDDFIKRVIAEG